MSEPAAPPIIGSRPVEAHVPMHVINLTDPRIGNLPQKGLFTLPDEVSALLRPLTPQNHGFLGFSAPMSLETDQIYGSPSIQLCHRRIIDHVCYIGAVGSVSGDLTNWNKQLYETKWGLIFRVPAVATTLFVCSLQEHATTGAVLEAFWGHAGEQG